MIARKYVIEKVLVCLSVVLVLPGLAIAHSGTTSKIAWAVCDEKPKSSACEYKGHHGERYIGTCQVMSESMICVRNQPIVPPEQSAEESTSETEKIATDAPAVSEIPVTPKQ